MVCTDVKLPFIIHTHQCRAVGRRPGWSPAACGGRARAGRKCPRCGSAGTWRYVLLRNRTGVYGRGRAIAMMHPRVGIPTAPHLSAWSRCKDVVSCATTLSGRRLPVCRLARATDARSGVGPERTEGGDRPVPPGPNGFAFVAIVTPGWRRHAMRPMISSLFPSQYM